MSGLSGECLTASKGRAGVLPGSTVLSELHAESGILQLGKGIAAPAAFPASNALLWGRLSPEGAAP